ncbi:MAG TPA: hypothetical protein VF636_02730 [Sphingomonas sp.]|jgi:hypothetical protein
MILALLLAQASAVDAERAFAADAQARGQWTAFRKWSTADATMFDPQPVKAHDFLRDRADPPRSVEWKPARSFVSCDGRMAANTGPWRAGGHGYFSTIWAKQPEGGWKWTVDGGDATKEPKFAWDAAPVVRRASCAGKPVPPVEIGYREGPSATIISPDGTLAYHWHVSGSGARTFSVHLWNGSSLEPVIDDRIAAPPCKPAAAPTP